MTGATGTIIAVRILQMLQDTDVETHLVMSKWAVRTLLHETSYRPEDVEQLATRVYASGDQGAAISSGSFVTDGMIVVPCSMRTLGAIAHGFGDHLIHRAADVILKERRRLVLAVRETPFNDIHLENMLKLSRMGAMSARRCPPSTHGRKPSTRSSTGPPRGCSTRWASTRNLHTGGTARWKPASNPDTTTFNASVGHGLKTVPLPEQIYFNRSATLAIPAFAQASSVSRLDPALPTAPIVSLPT